MSAAFQTKLLTVDKSSVTFPKSSTQPHISDQLTLENLTEAADILTNTSNAVAFPTETVYGLGGSALNDESVKSIYAAKNRPADNPLITHVSSLEQLTRKFLGSDPIPSIYKPLIEKFWPGPLTILLPVRKDSPISKLVTAGQPTFAVRIPADPVARSLIAISDTPLAAPSANASTKPSPTLASHVFYDLEGKIPLILDGGPCSVGLESTVVDGLSKPPMLLRPGGISLEEIRSAGGSEWSDIVVAKKSAGENEKVRTPGMKYKHYSPKAKVVVFNRCGDGSDHIRRYLKEAVKIGQKVALLKSVKFAKADHISDLITLEDDLGTSGAEISRNLFAKLRKLDEAGADVILVEGIEEENHGLAIMNRLSKAAQEVIEGDSK